MQDDNTIQPTDEISDSQSTIQPAVVEPTLSLGANPSDQTIDAATTDIPTDSNSVAADNGATGTQVTDNTSADTSGTDNTSSDIAVSEESKTEDAAAAQISSASSDDLESIRSSALDELTPIISELDQEPEEKYRTLMMLIQASDNQSLIKEAYEAAHKIEDTKAKAEALLNIVNEINYFTGKAGKPEN